MVVFAIIVVVVIALAAAWYFSGRILKPEREEREAREAAEKSPVKSSPDIWQGFAEAHANNPPIFEENDSWDAKRVVERPKFS